MARSACSASAVARASSAGRSVGIGVAAGEPGERGVRRRLLTVHDRDPGGERHQGRGEQPGPRRVRRRRCPPPGATPDTAAAPSSQASGRRASPPRQRTTSTTTQSSWSTVNGGDRDDVPQRRDHRGARVLRAGGRADTRGHVAHRPAGGQRGREERDQHRHGHDRAPPRCRQPAVGEADDPDGHQARATAGPARCRPRPTSPPRRGAGVADLAAEEHHGLDRADRHHEPTHEVTGPLVQHVGAHAGEGEGEQAVVEVRQPQPLREPDDDQNEHRAQRQQRRRGHGERALGSWRTSWHRRRQRVSRENPARRIQGSPRGAGPRCRPQAAGHDHSVTTAAPTATPRHPRAASAHRSLPRGRPVAYLAADTTYAARGWDDATAGVLQVLASIAYGWSSCGSPAGLRPDAVLRAALVRGRRRSGRRARWPTASTRSTSRSATLARRPDGRRDPHQAARAVLPARPRAGVRQRWPGSALAGRRPSCSSSGLRWPVSHIGNIALLAVAANVVLVLGLSSLLWRPPTAGEWRRIGDSNP